MNNIISITRSLFDALALIRQRNLYYFLLFPSLISLLIIGTAMYSISEFSGFVLEYVNQFGLESVLPSWLESTLSFLLSFLIKMVGWMIVGYFFKYILLIILSPALSYVSQVTLDKLEGNSAPFSFSKMLNDIIRAIVIVIKNGAKQLICIIILFILTFIPFVNFLVPFLALAVEFYFLGYSLLDYGLEAKGSNAKSTAEFIWNNKMETIALGGFFYVILLIPILGWMVGPILCVMAGTIFIFKKHQVKI